MMRVRVRSPKRANENSPKTEDDYDHDSSFCDTSRFPFSSHRVFVPPYESVTRSHLLLRPSSTYRPRRKPPSRIGDRKGRQHFTTTIKIIDQDQERTKVGMVAALQHRRGQFSPLIESTIDALNHKIEKQTLKLAIRHQTHRIQ